MTAPRSLGFHHLALQAEDVEAVAAFYRTVLGLKERRRWLRDDGTLRSIWLDVAEDDAAGFLAIEHLPGAPRPPEPVLGPTMIALRIEPAARAATLARLEALGVPLVKQTAWTLYVRDPEGTLVGLSHHPFDVPA